MLCVLQAAAGTAAQYSGHMLFVRACNLLSGLPETHSNWKRPMQ